jgi:hypothetical protein
MSAPGQATLGDWQTFTPQLNRDPGVTPAQGRVVFHMERLFRSTGGGVKAHGTFLAACRTKGISPAVPSYTPTRCVEVLQMIESACRHHGMHLFRDVSTGWRQINLEVTQ